MLRYRNRVAQKPCDGPEQTCSQPEVGGEMTIRGKVNGELGLGDTQLVGSSSEGQRHLDFMGAKESVRRADLALSTECKEPHNEAERKLAAIWRDVFGIDVIGVTDDFFELGGDSFTATALAAEIEATFGTRFTPADIITLSTVAQRPEARQGGIASVSRLPHLGPGRGPAPSLWCMAARGLHSSRRCSSISSARSARSMCSRLQVFMGA
jgi:acyl carrier protein